MNKKETVTGQLKGRTVGGIEIGKLAQCHFRQGQRIRVTMEVVPYLWEQIQQDVATIIACNIMGDPKEWDDSDVLGLAEILVKFGAVHIDATKAHWEFYRWADAAEYFRLLACEALDGR